ncbi:unnamed protein product [Ectocarpus sp. 12 AP-2014]
MAIWTTTSLSVGEANALITVVSKVVCYCMSLMFASVCLEIRRLMVILGKGDAIIQDEGYSSMWSLYRASNARRWTALAVLPVLMSGAVSLLVDFTTAGVTASIGHTEGDEVHVMGLVGDEVTYEYKIGRDDEEGVYVYGNKYEAPIAVDITFCVEVDEIEIDDAFAITECREGLIVDKIVKSFNVASVATAVSVVIDVDNNCTTLYDDIPLGNQGVGIVERDFTLNDTDGIEVAAAATCSSITESIIESCVWEDNGLLYFGDWNILGAGSCDDTNNGDDALLSILAIDYGQRVEQGSNTAALLASMTAEIFAGTGLLTSRQQLVDVLGAIVRLESMAWKVQTAYDPVDVVEIGVSAWVPVVLLLALLLPVMAWGLVKWHIRSGKDFFLPVSLAEWSACAARELGEAGNERGSRSLEITKPREEHFRQVYAFGPPVMGADEGSGGSQQQRLGWVNRRAVTQAPTGKMAPFR